MSDEWKYKIGAMSDKIDKLVELNEKQTDSIHKLDMGLTKTNTILEVNTQELHEHKEGVIQNRSHIRALETQLANHAEQSMKNTAAIENDLKPLKDKETAKKVLMKWFLGAGALAAAAVSILKFLGYF